MTHRIILDLPSDAMSSIRVSPEEFGRELRIAAAVKWYELGKVSQEKAAEIAGLTRQEFILSLSRFDVSPIQVRPSELADEISGI